jgi:predicted ATP-grasp superfamily ATP-dependent carboligase
VGERVLVKPVDGVGCDGIGFFSPRSRRDGVIFQEFLDGAHASCCLLMGRKEGAVLSVNRQEIIIGDGGFEYRGSEIPLEHEASEACVEVALRAAEALNLRGYCGVDLVVGKAPRVVEVNPRLTTSFVALARMTRANLGELLVNALVDGSRPRGVEVKGHGVVRVLEIKRAIKMNRKILDGLREIPGVIAPPPSGHLKAPRMLVAGFGSSARSAEREVLKAAEGTLALFGAGQCAVAWS